MSRDDDSTEQFEREQTQVDVFQPEVFSEPRHPAAELTDSCPPSPARILCRQAEKDAPQVTWEVCDERAVRGFYRGAVVFDVHLVAVRLQPMIVEISMGLKEYPLRFESRGVLDDAWRSLVEQLEKTRKDLSIASFFIAPRR